MTVADGGTSTVGGTLTTVGPVEFKTSEHAPDAVIYVPGLRLEASDERTFEGVAERIRAACDKQAATRAATFTRESRTVQMSVGTLQRATISRHDGDQTTAVVDVYEFPWARAMSERWEKQDSRSRALAGMIGFYGGLRLTLQLTKSSLKVGDWSERRRRIAQAILAFVGLLIILAYLLLVIGSAIAAVGQIAQDSPKLQIFQQISLIITGALAVLSPALKNRIPAIGSALLAADNYIRFPNEPTRIAGELTALIEELQQTAGHDRIHVVGYSMGAIVAYDTLHPMTGQAQTLNGVHRLLTIGPVFDMVRATRRNYFEDRTSPAVPVDWVNYWSPADLLSSPRPRTKSDKKPASAQSPRSKSAKAPPPVVAGVENLVEKTYKIPVDDGFLSMLALYGFKSHGLYWGDDGVADNNVFDQVVVDLLPTTESTALR